MSIGAGGSARPREARKGQAAMSEDTEFDSYPGNLSDCPMCGETASIDKDNGRHLVSCTFCGLELSGMIDYAAAIELWNRMSKGCAAPYAKDR